MLHCSLTTCYLDQVELTAHPFEPHLPYSPEPPSKLPEHVSLQNPLIHISK